MFSLAGKQHRTILDTKYPNAPLVPHSETYREDGEFINACVREGCGHVVKGCVIGLGPWRIKGLHKRHGPGRMFPCLTSVEKTTLQ